jgi:hypothetical protein
MKEKNIFFWNFILNNEHLYKDSSELKPVFGGKRYCGKGDFRASGSGFSKYEPELLNKNFIGTTFHFAKN